MSCGEDPDGCHRGAYRYHGRRKQSTHDVRQAVGFTLSGPSGAYVLLPGNDLEGGADFACPCRLVHRTGIAWG